MPSSAAPTRGWTASCASRPLTPPRSAHEAGMQCWRPTASTTPSSPSRGSRRPSARCSSAPWTTRRTAAGSSASWPKDGRSSSGRFRERACRSRVPEASGSREELGLVEDLPAVLAAARAVVVPIWEGGGTRLKVLEALAAGRAVVSTPLGAEGIGFEDGRHGLLASTAEELGAALATVLADPGARFGAERPQARRALPLAGRARRRLGLLCQGRAHVSAVLADTESSRRAKTKTANPSRGGDAKPRDPHGSAGLPKGANT